MRVIIYYRVSTKLQEDKFSLKAQKQELTKYANSQGWEIVGEFRDVDSGGKLDKVGLNAMLDRIEEDEVDVVLCIDQDRLSRLDTVAWEFLKDALRDNKVKIAEPGSMTDLSNEDQEFMSDIKNLMARKEKRTIVRRMMRGKRQRTREGKGWGRSPIEYLYDKNTSTYSINEKWSWLIPFIDELYLDKDKSDQAIAKELNKICKTPTGKTWSDTHVRQKLTNEAYCGRMIKSFSNGETIVVDDVYPRLRSDEQHQKIQEKRKNKFRRKPMTTPQLLRRVHMECAYCGRKLAIHMSGVKEYGLHFYITHNKKQQNIAQGRCEFTLNTLRVEHNIISAVKSIIKGEEFAKKYIQLEYDPDDLQQMEKEIKQVAKLQTDVRAKIDRLLALYLDGSWSKEQLDQQKKLLESELKVHESRHRQLSSKRDLVKANQFNYDTVVQYLAVAERFDVLLEKDEQMEMIGRLFPEAKVFEDHIMLYGMLPNDIPIEVRVPVDENPNKVRKTSVRDPEDKYEKVQQWLNEQQGASLKDAADHFGFAESTVYRLQHKFGPFQNVIKKTEHRPLEKLEVIKAYLEKEPGAGYRKISRATGIPPSTVDRLLRTYIK